MKRLVSFVIVAVAAICLAGGPSTQPAKTKITISRETTYITGPLKPDGTVDYQAAINDEYGRGVTHENNAAIPLLEALGPESIDEKYRSALIEKLGLKFQPGDRYLEPFEKFAERAGYDAEQAGKMLDRARSSPWREADNPVVAKWLRENRQPLDNFVAATSRPKFFVPLLAPENGKSLLENMPFLAVPAVPWFVTANTLASRANLAMSNGQFQDAWGDIQAILRVGQLVGQGATLVDRLVGAAVLAVGENTVLQWSYKGALTSKQCRDVYNAFSATKVPDLVACWRFGERLALLDLWTRISQESSSFGFIRDFAQDADKQRAEFVLSFLKTAEAGTVDWNGLLRQVNHEIDERIAALGLTSYPQRRSALEALSVQWGRRLKAAESLWKCSESKPVTATASTTQACTRAVTVGELLLAADMTDYAADALKLATFQARIEAKREIALMAIALASCKAETGEYPQKLASLVAKYIPTLPKDPFSDDEFKYKVTGAGYVLYSVGPNLKDDGGPGGAAECDDVGIQVPPAPEGGSKQGP